MIIVQHNYFVLRAKDIGDILVQVDVCTNGFCLDTTNLIQQPW